MDGGRVRIGGTCGTFLKKQDSKGRGGRGEGSAAECWRDNNAGDVDMSRRGYDARKERRMETNEIM
jgi:hypothetical protein